MGHIAGVKPQQGKHEQQNDAERHLGIHMRNMLHFNAFEALHMNKKPAAKKNENGNGHDQGKNVAAGHHYIIKSAHHLQGAFDAKKAVDHHFDATDQNHKKSPEDQGMHNSRKGLSEHFRLPQGYLHRKRNALADVLYGKCGFGELKQLHIPPGGIAKYPKSK